MYICLNCNNKTGFLRPRHMSEYYTEDQIVNQYDETIDLSEQYDVDNEEGLTDPLKCVVCNSENIEDVDEETWEDWDGPENPGIKKQKNETWESFFKRRNM